MSKAFGCVGNTILLRSGRYLDLLHPQPSQFTFHDIAGALAKLCRFGGQVDRFYSVAEHCVLCERQAAVDGHSRECRKAVLMHDAAEAFIGDVVKPLKILLGPYVAIEERLEAAIADKFDIDFRSHADTVREIDHAMLIAERNVLFRRSGSELWEGESSVRSIHPAVFNWTPPSAEGRFCFHAAEIGINTTV